MSLDRVLRTHDDIEYFLRENLQLCQYLEQNSSINSHILPKCTNISQKVSEIAVKIYQASLDITDVNVYNTYDSPEHRYYDFKSDKQREILREKIIGELLSKRRIENDDEISLGVGGMAPQKPQRRKKIFFIIGSPASGKSTIANKIADANGAYILDSDYCKRKIPEFKKINGATLVHKESKKILESVRQTLVGNGINIVYPIIGDSFSDFEHTIFQFKENGYKVYIILAELDRRKATIRALLRYILTDRYIPLTMILDEYSNEPIITYYKMLELHKLECSYLHINTDVNIGEPPIVISSHKALDIMNII